MKVLLVITIEKLAEKLTALNRKLEYCAIAVDQVEPAKEILLKVGLSPDLLYPMSELKNCVESLKYDYVLNVQDTYYGRQIKLFQNYNLQLEKLVSFAGLENASNWQTERQLRYYREHSQEFEMFATGTSPTATAIDIRKFKRKTINFATSSQDLYYNFRIAKSVISHAKVNNAIRYALIGLSPYSFHFDLSKTFLWRCRLLPYLIAFNDLHNLSVSADICREFLSEEWLSKKPSVAKVNINGVKSQKVMENPLESNSGIITWKGKYYPETRDENIKILDEYLTLCEENNVRPIMFRVINSEKYMANFSKNLLEEFNCLVEQACQKHSSAVFIDGWKWNGVTYSDFYDHAHMNIHGAAKFSAYLNEFIEQLER
ncbi:MAG: hypothetical protein IKZ53_08405 [Selenomonadaceae bacterium]|nr:hypothetical protein [Selenomonadaceae bacterium]